MAGDMVPVGAADVVQAPAVTEIAISPRAAKIAAFREGQAKSAETAAQPAEVAPVVEAPAEKPAEVAPEADDPKTAKGIEAIEKRDARARAALATEKAEWKARYDLEVAELAKMRADMTGKTTSLEDLRKLAKSKPLEALRHLGIESEDDLEVVARQTYAHSKSGKADPKNKAYAEQTSKEREYQTAIEELRQKQEALDNEFKTRDQRAQMEAFQAQYLDAAVKAIPAEPSFIGKAHTANPGKARAALLALGQLMERENDETPSHAEVIAQYEQNKRAELADSGLTEAEISALLRPAVAAVAKPAPPKTLDLNARTSATTPINGNPTREQRIAAARAVREKLSAETP